MSFCFSIHNLLLIKTSSFTEQNIIFCIVKRYVFVRSLLSYSYNYIKHKTAQYSLLIFLHIRY